jgi:hypothetical protein
MRSHFQVAIHNALAANQVLGRPQVRTYLALIWHKCAREPLQKPPNLLMQACVLGGAVGAGVHAGQARGFVFVEAAQWHSLCGQPMAYAVPLVCCVVSLSCHPCSFAVSGGHVSELGH